MEYGMSPEEFAETYVFYIYDEAIISQLISEYGLTDIEACAIIEVAKEKLLAENN